MPKTRLDLLLEEKGMVASRSSAQRLIMAGQVRVNGQIVYKPATHIQSSDTLEIIQPPPFVSRGGEKLLGALEAFELLDLRGLVCVDVGASTGGFTDCLLQHGVAKVYALDVGYGILHWKMRNHPQVISMERTNARYVKGFDDTIQLVTIDASFISLKTILPVVRTWFKESDGSVIALIKPQFEAGRTDAAKGGGVIRDAAIHRRVVEEILHHSLQEGYEIRGLIRSPLTGPKGNIEFLIYLKYPAEINGSLLEWAERLFPPVTESEDSTNLS